MGEEKMLDWSTIDYRIKEITYGGKYYFTMGHVKEGYYCLIYDSTDENSPVVVVNQEESLQQAVSNAINQFVKKFLDNEWSRL